MRNVEIRRFKKWFTDYVAGFYGSDRYVNANIKLKELHSHRVCKEMEYLAESLGLPSDKKRIAWTIALFHDIGRFEQFRQYRTYNDFESIDHCGLGLKVLKNRKVLDCLDGREAVLVRAAIGYHGVKQLPQGLSGDTMLFSRLIRDADKLDILPYLIKRYKRYLRDPKSFPFEFGFPDKPVYTKAVVRDILAGRRIEYRKLRTLNDMKLLVVGWVYDVNFTAALVRIKRRRSMDKIIDFLPQTAEIKEVRKKIRDYIDKKIVRNG